MTLNAIGKWWDKSRDDNYLCVVTFIALPIVAALLMGAVWGVVDWLQSYGTGLSPFPYFDHSPFRAEPFHQRTGDTLLRSLADIIDWYNLNFRGATRFGSGLGLIAGAFMAMNLFSDKGIVSRTVAGALAGASIGARSVLMLGSGAPLFLLGFILGSIAGALYMMLCAGPPKFEALPLEKLPDPATDAA